MVTTNFCRACLLAAIQTDTGSAQSTIKLVATNFIANGRIWEGMYRLLKIFQTNILSYRFFVKVHFF